MDFSLSHMTTKVMSLNSLNLDLCHYRFKSFALPLSHIQILQELIKWARNSNQPIAQNTKANIDKL